MVEPTPERRLMRIQALSGLVFALFLLQHLLNVMASVFGPGLYDAFQVQLRPIYQSPLIEVGLLLSALLVHIVVGVVRVRRRPRSRDGSRLPRRTRLHRLSAYLLLLFIFGHIAATRGPTLLDGFWLGFAGVSFSVWALPAFFYPYYGLLGLCGLYHGSYGSYLALRSLGVRLPTVAAMGARAWVPLAVAGVLIILGVLSFGGHLYAIDDPLDSDLARFARDRVGFEP
jgi:succinate dehydrogenase/fumarate reductase cytochrome b subunit